MYFTSSGVDSSMRTLSRCIHMACQFYRLQNGQVTTTFCAPVITRLCAELACEIYIDRQTDRQTDRQIVALVKQAYVHT